MEERDEAKPPKIKVKGKNGNPKFSVTEINLDEIKKDSTLQQLSPRGGAGAGLATAKQPSGGRWNCLCSPTTHAGSFRCRHHRVSGMTRSGGSVGSNLSLLGQSKSQTISDSLKAQ